VVVARETPYVGSLNASYIRTAEVFRGAVRHSAAAIIVAHNHPSLDPTPSPEDVTVTRALHEAGKLVDIEPPHHAGLAGSASSACARGGWGSRVYEARRRRSRIAAHAPLSRSGVQWAGLHPQWCAFFGEIDPP
jgi:hypothetical protein